MAHPSEEALPTVASPVVCVIPVAFKTMGNEQILVVGANFEGRVLFPANAAVGQLLVTFCASKTRDLRKRAMVGTAPNKLQVAVAYLGHGVFHFGSILLRVSRIRLVTGHDFSCVANLKKLRALALRRHPEIDLSPVRKEQVD
jgi:hypothetical protein